MNQNLDGNKKGPKNSSVTRARNSCSGTSVAAVLASAGALPCRGSSTSIDQSSAVALPLKRSRGRKDSSEHHLRSKCAVALTTSAAALSSSNSRRDFPLLLRCLDRLVLYPNIAKMHNQKFSKSLVELEKLNGFTYSIFDIATAIANRMTNPLKYGFKEGIKACCGIGPLNGRYSCGGKRENYGPDYLLCDDPRENFFFDPCHPCQVGYKQLADLFWNGNISVVVPYGLYTQFHGEEELPIAQE